jgi:hypothetical protein
VVSKPLTIVAAAAAEAVEAVVEAAADATDAGAAAAAAAVYHGAVAASVRLERLPISARNANHDGRAWPGQLCFARDAADMMNARAKPVQGGERVIGWAYQ